MNVLAGGDLALPAQIAWSDIWYISSRVLIIALCVTVIGIVVLRQVVCVLVAEALHRSYSAACAV